MSSAARILRVALGRGDLAAPQLSRGYCEFARPQAVQEGDGCRDEARNVCLVHLFVKPLNQPWFLDRDACRDNVQPICRNIELMGLCTCIYIYIHVCVYTCMDRTNMLYMFTDRQLLAVCGWWLLIQAVGVRLHLRSLVILLLKDSLRLLQSGDAPGMGERSVEIWIGVARPEFQLHT